MTVKKIVGITDVLGRTFTVDQSPVAMPGYIVESIEYMMLGLIGVNRLHDKGYYKLTLIKQINDKEKIFNAISAPHTVGVTWIEAEEEEKDACETSRVSLKKAE